MRRVTPGAIALQPEDLILSDFDGTISLIDTGVAMIDTLAPADAAAAWEDEYAWRRGEINSMECLRRQWRTFYPTEAEALAFVDGLEVDPDFLALLALARTRGTGIAILSDGLDFYLDRMFANLGLRTCGDDSCLRATDCLLRFSNAATFGPDGLRIEFPYCNACGQCGNCKVEHLFRLRRSATRVIYLGDGHSDLCAARFADLIFAKHALAEDCQSAGRPYIPFETFADVMRVLA